MRSLRSPHIRRKRNIRTFAKVLFFLAIFLIAFGIPLYIVRLSSLQIKTVTVTGVTSISSEEIVSNTEGILNQNYFYVIPKRNMFFYPGSTIEKTLKDFFPKIETIRVHREPDRALHIEITERTAKGAWCATSTLDDCYLLDAVGYIFAKSPTFTDAVYFVYRGDNNTDNPIGHSYLTLDQFTQIQSVVSRIQLLALTPISVSYIQNNEFEIMVEGGGSIFISLRDNVDKNISNLESVLSDSGAAMLVDGKLTVQSIDLRYGNKIIIKKKGGI